MIFWLRPSNRKVVAGHFQIARSVKCSGVFESGEKNTTFPIIWNHSGVAGEFLPGKRCGSFESDPERGHENFPSDRINGGSWASPETHAVYPIRWKILVPSLGITLEASTPLPWQELTSNSRMVPNYWEGGIFLTGFKNSTALHGSGYLEMTGYDLPIRRP